MAVDREKTQKQAEKLIATGKIDAGIAQYNLLVQDNPRDLGTLNKIGDLYVRLSRKADAIRTFARIAEIYADDGFFLKAIAIYKKITKIDPTHLDTLQRLAELYGKQGLKTEARAQFLAVAETMVKVGQPHKAISAYESLASLDPENTGHRLALAEMKLKYGKGDDAARTFLDLAQELDRKGNSKESVRVWEMALKVGRGNPKLAEGLCSALKAAGQHDKAVKVADDILKDSPHNATILAIRGESLEALGRSNEAEEALRKSLGSDPKKAETALALARLLVQRKAIGEAMEIITAAFDSIMIAERGQELAMILESVLAEDPLNRHAVESLFRVHTLVGNKAGTLQVGDGLVEICAEQKRFSEALAVARRLADLDPTAARRDKVARIQRLAEGGAPEEDDADRTPAGQDRAASRPAAAEPAPEVEEAIEEALEADVAIEAATPAQDHEPTGRAPVASGPETGPEDAGFSPEDDEFISEHLTEAEVFVKYGLADRAIEQLGSIINRFPSHINARKRLRDVYLEEGNRDRAAAEAAILGRIYLERGDRSAALAAVQEARSIEGACPIISEVESLLGIETPLRPAAPAPAGSSVSRSRIESEPTDLVIEEEEEIEESVVSPARKGLDGPPPEDLEEFEFYMSQGMTMEAAACLSRLEARYGPHPDLESRRLALGQASVEGSRTSGATGPREAFEVASSIEAVRTEALAGDDSGPPGSTKPVEKIEEVRAEPPAPQPVAAAARKDDFFDLAAELDASLFSEKESADEQAVLSGIEASPEGHSLDEIVQAFKKGIEKQVDAEDFETHYNLGIAYKEMGLTEEAIAEFQFAAKEPRLLPDCCSMLGLLFREKGMHSLAVKWYRKGMDALIAGDDEERLNGVRFDLAEVLEQMGEYRQALDLFTEVYGVDSRYRDVAARIKSLASRLAG